MPGGHQKASQVKNEVHRCLYCVTCGLFLLDSDIYTASKGKDTFSLMQSIW